MCPKARTLTRTLMVLLLLAGTAAAEEAHSQAAAKTLVQLLQSHGLIRSAHGTLQRRTGSLPLYIPGDQLLVVTGTHQTPDLLNLRIQQTTFRDLYLDLQATLAPKGKLFVMDSGGNGLRASRPGELFDIRVRGRREEQEVDPSAVRREQPPAHAHRLGGLSNSQIAVSPRVPVFGAVLEPGLRHDDRASVSAISPRGMA
jgi:hypothetical protein